MDVANEILDAIEIIVDKKIKEQTTQIYPGICKSVNGNSCVMSINGKDNTVQFYGSAPIVGTIYRVFVPYGNMSMAFIITANDNGSSASGVSSVNGLTGDVNLTANSIGAWPQGRWTYLYDGVLNEAGYLNTAGWYRIMRTKAVSSFLIHIGHSYYTGGPGDMLSYVNTYEHNPSIVILSNSIKEGYQFYTKLRITKDSNYKYIDFYCNLSLRFTPMISFIEFFAGGGSHNTEPQPLTPVAESPSGETIVLTQNIGVIASGNVVTTVG